MIHISLQNSDFDNVKKSLQAIPEVKDAVLTSSENNTIHFYVTCASEKDVRPELYEIIKKNGWPLLEFHMKTRTLETIFRELTKES